MDCKKCEREIYKYIDGELKGEEVTKFLQHIAACPSCQKEFKGAMGIDKVLSAALPIQKAPIGFSDSVMAAIEAEANSNVKSMTNSQAYKNKQKQTRNKYDKRGFIAGIGSLVAAAVLIFVLWGADLISSDSGNIATKPDDNSTIADLNNGAPNNQALIKNQLNQENQNFVLPGIGNTGNKEKAKDILVGGLDPSSAANVKINGIKAGEINNIKLDNNNDALTDNKNNVVVAKNTANKNLGKTSTTSKTDKNTDNKVQQNKPNATVKPDNKKPESVNVADANNSTISNEEKENISYGKREEGQFNVRLLASYNSHNATTPCFASNNTLQYLVHTEQDTEIWETDFAGDTMPKYLPAAPAFANEKQKEVENITWVKDKQGVAYVSPDNHHVAMLADDGLYVSDNIVKAQPDQISTVNTGELLLWAPNGSKLLFNDKDGILYVADPEEKSVQAITTDGTVEKAAWANNSNNIAFDYKKDNSKEKEIYGAIVK